MQSAIEKLSLKLTASLTDAEVYLRKIPNDDPVSFKDYVLSRIKTGEYHACYIHLDNEVLGLQVYRIEDFGGYKELVSICTYIEKSFLDFSSFWEREIEKLCKHHSCKSWRFHTIRHGLVKKALANGAHVAEITIRKYIK